MFTRKRLEEFVVDGRVFHLLWSSPMKGHLYRITGRAPYTRLVEVRTRRQAQEWAVYYAAKAREVK